MIDPEALADRFDAALAEVRLCLGAAHHVIAFQGGGSHRLNEAMRRVKAGVMGPYEWEDARQDALIAFGEKASPAPLRPVREVPSRPAKSLARPMQGERVLVETPHRIIYVDGAGNTRCERVRG